MAGAEHLLLIDDQEVDLAMYLRVIRRAGYTGDAHTFVYAEDALTFLREPSNPRIDLLFLDINMPRMNGFEFIEAVSDDLGEQLSSIKLIILTTSIEQSDRDRAMQTGFVSGFINKPLKVEDVQKALSSVEGGAPT